MADVGKGGSLLVLEVSGKDISFDLEAVKSKSLESLFMYLTIFFLYS